LREPTVLSFAETGRATGSPPTNALFTYEFDLSPQGRSAPAHAQTSAVPPGARPKQYIRAAVELFAMIGPFGTTWYWFNQDFNQSDWELQWDGKSWRRKIITFDAVRFDSNHFSTNALLHPFATGMWYHVAGRSNHLSMGEALLFSSAASAIWEYLVEFKELVSLNDIIVTPLAGLPFGEVFYQYGEMFSRGRRESLNGVLGLLFGVPQRFHALLDGTPIPKAPETDRFGFPNDVAHEFEVYTGAGLISTNDEEDEPRDRAEIGVRTEIITLRGYDRPGYVPWSVTSDNFTKLAARFVVSSGGVKHISVYAKASYGGVYWKAIDRGPARDLRGVSFFAGLGSAYEYSLRSARGFEDRLGIVSVLGPVVDFTARGGGLKVRAGLDVFGDFAMMTPYASKTFFEHVKGTQTKSVLQFDHYYYGGGVSVVPEISISYESLNAGVEARFDYIRSIEGLDRTEEHIVEKAPAADRRETYRVWLAYVFPQRAMRLSVSREEVFRSGWISIYSNADSVATYLTSLALIF
jgi:hypothetical protein